MNWYDEEKFDADQYWGLKGEQSTGERDWSVLGA